jgi:hypothetical protein
MMDPERLLAALPTWLVPAAAVASIGVGVVAGLGPALLVLAGSALVGAVFLFWSSLGRLTGESPLTLEEAVGLGAPSPEEERKRSILRALKDLEYERSVGKISEEDFAELSARYRAEAKALLQSLEGELAPLRNKAEKRLASRLKKEGIESAHDEPAGSGSDGARAGEDAPSADPSESGPTHSEPREISVSGPHAVCAKCATRNDADASFCKRCGAPIAATEAS